MGQGTTLMNDEKSRVQFINSVKDKALEFLMAYLPTAKVPPVEGEKDGVEYTLSNIDLSGFKVQSKDVEVAINEQDGLSIWAINISCVMSGLEFTYKKNTFPKLSGNGKAEAIASGVKFHIRLDLELPERYKKLVSPLSSKSPSPTAAASSASASPALSNTPTAASSTPATPSKKVLIGSNLSKQIATNAASTPANNAAGKPPLSVNTAQQKAAAAAQQQQQQQQQGKLFTFPKSNSSTAVAGSTNPLSPNQAPSPRSAYTPGGTPVPQENVIRQQKAVARAVASDTPRLILSKTKVVLSQFQLKLLAGDMKWLLNFLLKVFDDTVKQYIQDQLNAVIDEQSSKLLATLNELSVDYLPLLEKILGKAERVVIKKTGKKTLMGAITGAEEEDGEAGKEEAAATAADGKDAKTATPAVNGADKKPVV